MKVHISLHVSDLQESVEFYKKMLGTGPAKHFPAGDSAEGRVGYAKFDLADPPLNLALNEGEVEGRGGLSHLGIQLESTENVNEFQRRWEEVGLIPRIEEEVACCYAMQDKAWVTDPDGNEWEAFTVLEDIEAGESSTGCCVPVEAEAGSKELPIAQSCC